MNLLIEVRKPYCTKIGYPTRDVAEWIRPVREQRLGVQLRTYRCKSRACRPWRVWHLTSKLESREKRRWRERREYRDALASWEGEGGA